MHTPGALIRSFDPVMSSVREFKQPVLLARARADVVNYRRSSRCVGAIADDHDVRKIGWDSACHKIPGKKISWGLRQWKSPAASAEKRLQVRHPPMVNVFVRLFEPPFLRISRKADPHVFVQELLKVDSDALAQRTHNNVSADSSFDRNVAIGIIQLPVNRIVADSFPNLSPRCLDDTR